LYLLKIPEGDCAILAGSYELTTQIVEGRVVWQRRDLTVFINLMIRGHPDYLSNACLLAILERGQCHWIDQRRYRRLVHPRHQTLHRDAVLCLSNRLCYHRFHPLDFTRNVPDGDLL